MTLLKNSLQIWFLPGKEFDASNSWRRGKFLTVRKADAETHLNMHGFDGSYKCSYLVGERWNRSIELMSLKCLKSNMYPLYNSYLVWSTPQLHPFQTCSNSFLHQDLFGPSHCKASPAFQQLHTHAHPLILEDQMFCSEPAEFPQSANNRKHDALLDDVLSSKTLCNSS